MARRRRTPGISSAIDPPVDAVRSLALRNPLAGEDIWVAYRRSGRFSRLLAAADRWRVQEFPATAGYNPVDTHFLKRDSRGWIWRGSPEGVHISDGRSVAPEDWIHIHPQNGLATGATDQYGFFEDADASVWIAGEEGVSHLQPDKSWFDAPHHAPAPRITRLEADGRDVAAGRRLSGRSSRENESTADRNGFARHAGVSRRAVSLPAQTAIHRLEILAGRQPGVRSPA